MSDTEKQKGFSLRKRQDRRQGVPKDPREGPPFQDRSRYPPQERPSKDGPVSRGPSAEVRRSPGPQGPPGPSPGESQPARPRPRRNDNTDASLKKRFSMRYVNPPDLSDGAPPMPGMPQVPPQFAGVDGRNGTSQVGSGRIDKRAIRDPNLKPDQFIASYLQNASEQDIAEFTRNLQKEKNRSSTELQANVYQNRTQFIKISKEAEKLKSEMQSLRTLMADLTTTLGQAAANMETGQHGSEDGARKRANRSSLANLEAMWNTQLQQLWKHIEGSQKFLAAIPGRHVVSESGHWAELDKATWKNRGPIHIVLLNDHLLVAAKKRKRVDTDNPKAQRAHSKLVAIKCWAVQDIELVDVATDASSQRRGHVQAADALTIRSDRDTYTFRSDRGRDSDKTELLTQFRRTKDELRRSQQAENRDAGIKAKEQEEYLATRDPAISQSTGLLRTLSNAKERSDVFFEFEGKNVNFRFIEGLIDELDIEIALQRFEPAVKTIERLRELASRSRGNAVAQEIITVKVEERATKLADILTRNLALSHMHLTPTKETVSHLNRLNFSARARQAYLSARSATIHARARQCVFEGDVLAHITNISYVYFTMMKNTIATCQQCFPASMMSACMVWAKTELDKFNEALGRALSGVPRDGEVWQEGLSRAKELAGGLAEVGVDFEGMIGAELDGQGATVQ